MNHRGGVRTARRTTSDAAKSSVGLLGRRVSIRLGYQLGVGFYDWTGNDLRLEGTITTVGRLMRSLQSNNVQPDDLFPRVLRTALRELAIEQLSRIAEIARSRGREIPAHLLVAMRKTEADHLHVPDFRYQAEKRFEALVRDRAATHPGLHSGTQVGGRDDGNGDVSRFGKRDTSPFDSPVPV